MRSSRSGPPVTPTIVYGGLDGNLSQPRYLEFQNSAGDLIAVRPCYVANTTGNGNAIYVKVNSPQTENFDQTDGWTHFIVPDGEVKDVSLGGKLFVETVLLATVGVDDLDDITVRGWL